MSVDDIFWADCWYCAGQASKRDKAAGASLSETIQFRMYLCPECGNKRCNKATWHGNACDKDWRQ